MFQLKVELLDKILLRRTKTSRAEDIQLPPRIGQFNGYTRIHEETMYRSNVM